MHSIALIVCPGFQFLSVAALSAFEFANDESGKALYDISIFSEHGGAVPSSLGTSIDTRPFRQTKIDTLLVAGAVKNRQPSQAVLTFLTKAAVHPCRVGAIGLGSFTLAEAGLLDKKLVTVHWQYASQMRRQFPKVRVDDNKIYIADGQIWTSAGMSGALDLTLGMVECDHGIELTRAIARRLVMYHHRTGDQPQQSALLELSPASDRIKQVLEYARNNLRRDLDIEELAGVAALSPRQFSRAFRTETGQSPAKAIESLRVEVAKSLLEDCQICLETVALASGFGDSRRMRRAFIRSTGLPPQRLRKLTGLKSD